MQLVPFRYRAQSSIASVKFMAARRCWITLKCALRSTRSRRRTRADSRPPAGNRRGCIMFEGTSCGVTTAFSGAYLICEAARRAAWCAREPSACRLPSRGCESDARRVSLEQLPGDREIGLCHAHRLEHGATRTRRRRLCRHQGAEQEYILLSNDTPDERPDQIAAFLEGGEGIDGDQSALEAVIVNFSHGRPEASDQIQVAIRFEPGALNEWLLC